MPEISTGHHNLFKLPAPAGGFFIGVNMASSSPWHHLYNTKRWYRLRYHQLQKQPLCEFHLRRNQVISATVVDHIKPHKGDETLFHDPDNLQSLCKRCHDSVKQRIEKGGTVTEFDNEGRVIW
ncbi:MULTISPECIES: HNH endonuclease [Klebsiella pneumoniae complex]|uniref:HNH endonuclease n=1 Tax=Klebsiella pneumoniae complex TaxID=3390273 RepID=UPI00333E4761